MKQFIFLMVLPPPRSAIAFSELQAYILDFGKQKHDRALVAEVQGKAVGVVWARIMNNYGHIAPDTPSLAISVYQESRDKGLGASLLMQMLSILKANGYSKASLSVQKANYAVKMYQKSGFQIVGESDEEYIMVVNLQKQL